MGIDEKKKMRQLAAILFFLILSSCIPLSIAPNIEDYTIKVARKFKRKLPKDYAFIFEDPKEANEFYNYINLKYELNDKYVERNVPFTMNDNKYFLSFYEKKKTTNYLDLFVPVLETTIRGSYEGDIEVNSDSQWYLILIVFDSNLDDCLEPNHKFRTEVISYLRELKQEYLKGNYSVVSN